MLRVAIDGPAGSGKSTIAKRISRLFNLTYIDTGAMYRSCAWLALKLGLDDEKLIDCLKMAGIVLEGDRVKVILNGQEYDVTDDIRTAEVTKKTSEVASNPEIRKILVEKQQQMARLKPVIMDGRDIGTVVIPDAEVKIFLVANPKERAKRRYNELLQKGVDVVFDDVYNDMIERDLKDQNRSSSPLKKADDAVEIDTTDMSIDEVVERVVNIIKEKGF